MWVLTDAKIPSTQSESTTIIEEKQHRSRALKPEVLREVKSPHSHFSTRAASCFWHDLSRESVLCVRLPQCTHKTGWFLSHMWLQRLRHKPPHAHTVFIALFPLSDCCSRARCWRVCSDSWLPSRCSPLISFQHLQPSERAHNPVKCTKGVSVQCHPIVQL